MKLQWYQYGLLGALLWCGLAYAIDEKTSALSGGFSISKDSLTHSLTFLEFSANGTYTVNVTASGGSFVSANASGATVTPSNQSSLFSSASASKLVSDTPDGFSFVFSGLFRPAGDEGGGNDLSWSVSVKTDFFYIKSDQSEGAKNITIPYGTSVKYTAYKGTSTQVSNWNITNFPAMEADAIRFNQSFWGGLWPWSASNIETPEPGMYTVSASAKSPASGTDTGTMTVVGVEYIKATAQTRSAISYTDSPVLADGICVDSYLGDPNDGLGIVTLTAKLIPETATITNQPEWYVGSEKVQMGGLTYQFNAYSKVPEIYRVSVKCGDSTKSIFIYVVSCFFVLVVDEPEFGSGKPLAVFDMSYPFYDVGHVGVGIDIWPNLAWDALPFREYKNMTNRGLRAGFYSQSKSNVVLLGYAPGILHNPDEHIGDYIKQYQIKIENAVNGLYKIRYDLTTPETYRLAKEIIYSLPTPYSKTNPYSFNCASYALTIGAMCEVSLPSAYDIWRGSLFGYSLLFDGDSPGFLGIRL